MLFKNLKGAEPDNNNGHKGPDTLVDQDFIGPPTQADYKHSLHCGNQQTASSASETFHEAASRWFQFGLQVIPVLPDTKRPAVRWDPWLDDLSLETIDSHWSRHPDHELGFITGDGLFVVDTDSPEAVAAFNQLMESLDISCNHIVDTTKGQHYYFKLAPGTIAKSDSHDTTQHPHRLDIKTGRALIILPPSTGKSVSISDAESADDLVEVGQDFIDAIYRHNGRTTPRQESAPRPTRLLAPQDEDQLVTDIRYLLQHIDPDCGYEDWRNAGMAIHHESGGSDTGFQLFDEWSSQGSKYPGHPDLITKWASFNGYAGTPITLGTLCKQAGDNGADLERVGEEFFDPIDDIHDVAGVVAQIIAQAQANPVSESEEHYLLKYSLTGKSAEFEAEMLEDTFVLGEIALLGQWTVVFAPPNTGKTLIAFWLLILGIKNGDIDPECVFYINADDSHAGLTTKLKLAEKYGFHMLAPGYADFKTDDLLRLLKKLGTSGQARGTIVLLDTMKKFANPMDKSECLRFGNGVRVFTSQGGTVIGLAHTNKNRTADGKPIPAGTSDFVDDSDCAYIMDTLDNKNDIRTVEFENIKDRGMVTKLAAYQYSTLAGLGYTGLLDSVTPVDDTKAGALRDAAERFDDRDAPLIQAITDCINERVTAKIAITRKAARATGDSQRQAQRVLEDYTGADPNEHHWNFTIGDRGVNTFALLPAPDDVPDTEEL